MFKVLFTTDGSEESREARRFLEALPLPAGSEVRVVSVLLEPVPLSGAYAGGFYAGGEALSEIRAAEQDAARKAVAGAAEALTREGVTVDVELRDGDPAREILDAGEEFGADLVVVGSRGLTGLDAFVLGSVARNVAKHCRRPVVVARAPRQGLREVILATDGSDHAKHAAQFLARLPLPADSHVTALNVYRPYQPFPGLFPTDREQFDDAVQQVQQQQREQGGGIVGAAAAALAAGGKRASQEVRDGDPATQILSLAEERGADLVVAGARGASLIEGLFVGSVADRLLKEARCSILIVP